MSNKKGIRYTNSKSALNLNKYTPEDIQKLLNSVEFKSAIARTLGVHIKAFNEYIEQHNLTYNPPKHKGSIQSDVKNKAKIKHSKPVEEPLDRFKMLFQQNKQKRMLEELKDGYY